MVQDATAQHSLEWRGTAWHSLAQPGTAWHSLAQLGTGTWAQSSSPWRARSPAHSGHLGQEGFRHPGQVLATLCRPRAGAGGSGSVQHPRPHPTARKYPERPPAPWSPCLTPGWGGILQHHTPSAPPAAAAPCPGPLRRGTPPRCAAQPRPATRTAAGDGGTEALGRAGGPRRCPHPSPCTRDTPALPAPHLHGLLVADGGLELLLEAGIALRPHLVQAVPGGVELRQGARVSGTARSSGGWAPAQGASQPAPPRDARDTVPCARTPAQHTHPPCSTAQGHPRGLGMRLPLLQGPAAARL